MSSKIAPSLPYTELHNQLSDSALQLTVDSPRIGVDLFVRVRGDYGSEKAENIQCFVDKLD